MHARTRKFALPAILFLLIIVIWLFQLNTPIFYMINSWHNLLPNTIWHGLDLIAYSKFFILPAISIILTLALNRDKLLSVMILWISFYICFELIKLMVHEARPFVVLPSNSFFWLDGYENVVKTAYRSFPSGHAGNITIFAIIVSALFANRKISGLINCTMIALVVLVALSRIISGWHWPVDVLAGVAIAYILGSMLRISRAR